MTGRKHFQALVSVLYNILIHQNQRVQPDKDSKSKSAMQSFPEVPLSETGITHYKSFILKLNNDLLSLI